EGEVHSGSNRKVVGEDDSHPVSANATALGDSAAHARRLVFHDHGGQLHVITSSSGMFEVLHWRWFLACNISQLSRFANIRKCMYLKAETVSFSNDDQEQRSVLGSILVGPGGLCGSCGLGFRAGRGLRLDRGPALGFGPLLGSSTTSLSVH